MPELLRDIDSSLLLADTAFDVLEPEAINLWIGDERSVSSLHKDHIENMYAVVSGEQIFTLFPPTDAAFLPEGEFPTLRYYIAEDKGQPSMRLGLSSAGCDYPTLRWIHYDPDADCSHHRGNATVLSSQFAHPLRCTLSAGEVLYIPAMWYHRVSQTCHTVAVNYWYDQRFDFRYVFYQTVKRISAAVEKPPGESSV
jgi:jumonji domain-containing protein 7